MPRQAHPSSTRTLPGSAPARAFQHAQIVALVAQHADQADRTTLALVNHLCHAQAGLELYNSPAVAGLRKGDSRLGQLKDALKRWPGRAEHLSVSCAQGGSPTKRALEPLFKQLWSFRSLEMTGLASLTAALRDAVGTIASNLVQLNLSFDKFQSSTFNLVQLLQRCPALRHLALAGLVLDAALSIKANSAPAYHLASLSLLETDVSDGWGVVLWLLGQSATSLKRLVSDSLTAMGCKDVLKLFPRLAHLGLNIGPGLDKNARLILSLAKLPRLSHLTVVLDNAGWDLGPRALAKAVKVVEEAVAKMDAKFSGKITVDVFGDMSEDEYSSDESGVEESDEDDDFVVGPARQRVAL